MAHIITTSMRGVFHAEIMARDGDTVEVRNARMCVYWSNDVRGVVGLAVTGPSANCRVTRAAPTARLDGVTATFECTPEADAAWEKEPWG